jgi:hypothetical protein
LESLAGYSSKCFWASPPFVRISHGRVQLRGFVEKHNNVGNPAVPSNKEISPGVSWHLTKAARYPFNPSVIAQLLGRGNGLILKVRVSDPELACDAVDLVSAAEYTPQDREMRHLRCRSRRWPRVDAQGHFHRRRREDCGSSRSIRCRT